MGGGSGPEAAPDEPCAKDAEASKCHALMLSHVVHVSPDSRKVPCPPCPISNYRLKFNCPTHSHNFESLRISQICG